MMTLVLIISFGLLFGYFATQNATPVIIHFLTYSTRPFPLYLIILVSIGLGLLVTTIINFLRWFSTNRKLGKKTKELKETENTVAELNKRLHKLELENTKLSSQLGNGRVDEDSI